MELKRKYREAMGFGFRGENGGTGKLWSLEFRCRLKLEELVSGGV